MRKRIIGSGIAGVFLVVGAVFFYWSMQPAVTKVTVQQNVQGASTPDYSLKPYSNQYFTAQLPARFNSRSSTSGTGKPILLQQLFTANSDANLYADQLALSVGFLPAGKLDDVSGVQLRSRSDAYTAVQFSWLSVEQGVAYERTDEGYELGVFLQHGGKYSTLVISGLNEKKEQLTHEIQLFVSSINWQ